MARLEQYSLEILLAGPGNVSVSQYVVETLLPRPTASPASITGAGVSQHLIEVMISQDVAKARISQDLVEVMMAPISNTAGIATGGTVGTTAWVSVE